MVYDLTQGRVYFRTVHAQRIRHVDVASFDLSCGPEVVALDIHRDLEGDVSHCFEPYGDDDSRAFIVKALEPVDTSSLGEDFKPGLCDHLAEYAKGFTCP